MPRTRDRFAGPLLGLARIADPLRLYRAQYRARVVGQSADWLRVDVRPDDELLPVMSNIYLHHGVPGLRVKLRLRDTPPIFVTVSWLDGSPTKPFAAIWAPMSPDNVEALAFPTRERLDLGQLDAADAVVKGSTYRDAEAQLHATLNTQLAAAAAALAAAGAAGSHTAAQPSLVAAGTALVAAGTALAAFEAKSETFLSQIVRTA
jgi:hypothetical protein